MNPSDALDRVMYLLDRELAPAPKVKAFERARDLVNDMDPDDLRKLHDEGRLKELPGIGDSTSGVIAEALEGKVPAYLTKLEKSSEIPIGEGGAIRAALKGDCHTHSHWSDGGAPIEKMAETARELGHDYLVMTDHSARLTIAHGLSAERLREQLVEIERINEEMAPFRILTGMEVDILEDGTLDMTDELLAQLDVVVASVHSKLSMEREAMTKRMVLAMASPHTDILGHCTGRNVTPRGRSGKVRPESEFDAELVFEACRQFDVAVEINCRPERLDPPRRLLSLALDMDCWFTVDTDAHAPGQLDWQPYGCARAEECGVPADRIINTRSADDLLAWTASHAE
jgi:putative hydrolase